MKKSIRPPENWQDFETLCKKLFGEIWGCPHTIKKNGRLGQSQAGIDVYGKPKGETEYWGIQCKGKDNYEDKKLTESEIDQEIIKASTFEPHLKVLIFATTASKDAQIEKYIRIKDQESSKNGRFEIVLYCWQDLVDLIEENRDTFNWYVNNIQFKDQFDVSITIDTGHDNGAIRPKFLKTITTYTQNPPQKHDFNKHASIAWMFEKPKMPFGKTNKSWCKLVITIKNTGSIVLEDWKLRLTFSNNVKKLEDDSPRPNIFNLSPNYALCTTWAYQEDRLVICKPLNNSPLIQKDTRSFTCYCIPDFDAEEVTVKCHLLARNFDRENEINIIVEPDYEVELLVEQVYSSDDEKKDITFSEWIIEE
ncbi:hypothetical protein QNI16_23485 [Cytophagaceae bacterium YF14B1]|uniref:Mrr-like domain-containing protein n=1 Tax=Xanthocytophaga flava TaxID=3048013 RepID=A0AAE3U8I7_9BACT|nr:hypothetical protein [Xanthocytophaga flavus]MDJ1483481.1 hypothetical protein [Xanthocytophaga flavus]